MTKLTSREVGVIGPMAERAMERWALGLKLQERVPERAIARLSGDVHPFVAISREPGAGGEEIGRLVAAELGAECLGNELLTYMAERCNLPANLVEFVDETTSSLLLDIFRRWLDTRVLTQDEYVHRLGEIMLMAARHGTAVFVGRGAQFLLPRDRAMAVYVIAPLERRVAYAMEHRGLDRAAAEVWLKETEQGRRDFLRRQFHQDAADIRLYDLVINLAHVDHQAAADMIVHAFRRRFDIPRP